MKKVIVTLFIMLFVVSYTNAQSKGSIGVGAEVGLASGDFADFFDYGAGFGGSARYEMSLTPTINGYISVGYLTWSGDYKYSSYEYNYVTNHLDAVEASFSTTTSAIVVMAGAKYYFVPNIYGVAEVGYSSFSFDAGGSSFGSLDSKLGFGAGAGIEIPMGTNLKLDCAAMYKLAATDFNYIDIRAGVKFGI